MPNGSHMDAQRIYDFRDVHLFKCIFNLGPRSVNMLLFRATLIRHCRWAVQNWSVFVTSLFFNG